MTINCEEITSNVLFDQYELDQYFLDEKFNVISSKNVIKDSYKVVCGARYHNHLHYEGPGLGCNGFFWINMMMNGYKCPKPFDVENNHDQIKILEQDFDKFEWVLKY